MGTWVMIFASMVQGAPALAPPSPDPAALIAAVAEELRPNVVRVVATTPGGGEASGFGTIIGRTGDRLWIATANHIVRSANQSGDLVKASRVEVYYFNAPGTARSAQIEAYNLEKPEDLAFLSAPASTGPSWRAAAVAPADPPKNEEVNLLGLGGRWESLARTAKVAALVPEANQLVIDLGGQPGSSGAPLVSTSGFVGILLEGDHTSWSALSYQFIKRVAEAHSFPWDLTARSAVCTRATNVCFSRSDNLGSGRLILGGPSGRLPVSDGTCADLAPGFYVFDSSAERLVCAPGGFALACDGPTRVTIVCAVDIRGTWDSEWGTVEFLPSLTSQVRFFGFTRSPMGMSEGTASATNAEVFLSGEGIGSDGVLGPWRGTLVVSGSRMSGSVTLKSGVRYPLVLTRSSNDRR